MCVFTIGYKLGDSFKQDSLVCALKVLELLTVYLTDNK